MSEPSRHLTNTIVQWIQSRRRVRIVAVIGERHMSHNVGCDRRSFLGAAMAAFGVPELVVNRFDSAQSGRGTPVYDQRHGEDE